MEENEGSLEEIKGDDELEEIANGAVGESKNEEVEEKANEEVEQDVVKYVAINSFISVLQLSGYIIA